MASLADNDSPLEWHGLSVMTWSLCSGMSNSRSSGFIIVFSQLACRPTFPSTCLSPDQPGYGQVVASSQTRRRTRRNTQAAAVTQIPREPHSNWTVVTPGGAAHSTNTLNVPIPHNSQFSRPHSSGPPISPDLSSDYSSSPQYSHRQIDSPDYHSSNRYAPYSSHASPIDRKSSIGSGLSLEIPSHILNRPSSSKPSENISLPPIKQSAGDSDRDTGSPYALPPISALEDLRGVDTYDSAAVLRRLRLDDDYPPSSMPNLDGPWTRRHSLSSNPHPYVSYPLWLCMKILTFISRASRSSESSRFQPYQSPRSYQDYTIKRSRSPPESLIEQRRRSDFSQEDSISNPSPISPATPNSGLSSHEGHSSFSDLKKLASMTDNRYPFPRISTASHHASRDWAHSSGKGDADNIRDHPVFRHGHRSPLEHDSDSESSSVPHRPWF